jgi:hypothetical protein
MHTNGHACRSSQAPSRLQPSGSPVAASHRPLPGTHSPPQALPTQELVHSVAPPHRPSSPQVSTVVLDAQRVALGVQSPPQPLATQAFKQETGANHWPSSLHDCSCVEEEQRMAPRVHSPVQASPLQVSLQGVASPHCPSAVHVSTEASFAQRVCPGLQTPPQSPPTQAYSHSSGGDHRPLSMQRWTRVTDRHSLEPAAHSPVWQAPSTQPFSHCTGGPHARSALQWVLSFPDRHFVSPATQAAPPSAVSPPGSNWGSATARPRSSIEQALSAKAAAMQATQLARWRPRPARSAGSRAAGARQVPRILCAPDFEITYWFHMAAFEPPQRGRFVPALSCGQVGVN